MSDFKKRESRRMSAVQAMIINEEKKDQINEKAVNNPANENIKPSSSLPEKEKLIQRGFYITPDLIKALSMQTIISGMDRSEIVREALKAYLSDTLDKIDIL